MASSSHSTAVSMSIARYSSAFSLYSSRMSTVSKDAPSSSPFQMISFICTRSMTPSNSSSAPMGSWHTRGVAPRLETIMSTVR